ncbi:MAG: nicotinamide-nucleotide amidohydrolase family protein [Candidatus Omnitrophica bacterium]|nr:nicotinamide-nucleotide amidohydrolase family protein [Candidatus Omnitrophota bacterium]
MREKLEEKVGKFLKRKKLTIAVAESCTGGLVLKRLTDVSGSSSYVKMGMVLYSNDAKDEFLKIPKKAIEKVGAVSGPVAHQMAKNVKKIAGTDFGVGITGIAGPSGGSKEKPVGLVFMSVVGPKDSITEYRIFKGTRSSIRNKAANYVFSLLLMII